MVTFFGWSPIVWRAHEHVHIMPLYLVHTCHGPPYQMTFWLNCPQNILHSDLHHLLHYELAHQICFRPQSCLVLFGHLLKGIWNFYIVVKKKKLWGYPTTHFLHVDENMFPSKCIQKWNHLLHVFDFAPITHANVHNILFVYCKM